MAWDTLGHAAESLAGLWARAMGCLTRRDCWGQPQAPAAALHGFPGWHGARVVLLAGLCSRVLQTFLTRALTSRLTRESGGSPAHRHCCWWARPEPKRSNSNIPRSPSPVVRVFRNSVTGKALSETDGPLCWQWGGCWWRLFWGGELGQWDEEDSVPAGHFPPTRGAEWGSPLQLLCCEFSEQCGLWHLICCGFASRGEVISCQTKCKDWSKPVLWLRHV